MECVKRLLVADASQEFRCHLVESFQNEPDMEVVGETGDGLQLLELTQKLLPDVIVMEMVLSGLDGLEVLERLRGLSLERHPKILVLSSYVRGSIADLAAAHKIYGRDLTRIPSIGWFADTVGKLIQGRIQNMG